MKKTRRRKTKTLILYSVGVIKLKKKIRWMVFAMCMAWLLTFLGCAKEKPHMLDGPGMEYQSPWRAFTLSRADSNTQYSFWFTVSDDGDQCLLTGECRDENGNSYIEKDGIEISAEDIWQLRWMDLDRLPDEEEWPEDLELPTDMASITLSLTLSDGTVVKKSASGDLSMEIYQLLLPYFEK